MTPSTPGGTDLAVVFVAKGLAADGGMTRARLEKLKKEAARKFELDRFLSNSEILSALHGQARDALREALQVHPRRSASGIVVVTAFSAPFSCPHGTCVFCPGGPGWGTPQSYLPDSPGMKTAVSVAFDPMKQVKTSLTKYRANGHPVGKVETIIEGGTFIAVPSEYQTSFVKGVYDGLNGIESPTLEVAQRVNEDAGSRCVGLTLESKPDWCRPQDIDRMLSFGITRLEIGVQSLRNRTLERSNRGHTVEDTVDAFRVARDAGLKVTAHMMPGLPGAVPEEDLADLRRLFDDESFRPDMLKLYPTLVIPGTALARQFEAGLFTPYSTEQVVELLSEMKRFVPRWLRIMRIQREIPSAEISGGVTQGNLRQLVLERATEKGIRCACIRCREVALADPAVLDDEDSLEYAEEMYDASGGSEVFGAWEYRDSGRIAGFVRMRIPSEMAHRPEAAGAAVVRELRVYGRAVDVGSRKGNAWQHKGIGGHLMGRMEELARGEFSRRRMLVTSAVGTRRYYAKLGYGRDGPYMSKAL